MIKRHTLEKTLKRTSKGLKHLESLSFVEDANIIMGGARDLQTSPQPLA